MLTARFDTDALRPPLPLPPGQARHPAQGHPAWAALRDWCLAGSGPGTRPFWSPSAAPHIDQPLALATLAGADAAALAHALCLERDGSLQLQVCRSAAARLRLRAATKLHDAMWWRARQPTDAWDSGYAINTPAGLRALQDFTPRRATLVVADGLTTPQLHALADTLQARQTSFSQPVRLLMLGAAGLPAGLAVTRLPLAGPSR